LKRDTDTKPLAERDVLAFDPGARVFQAFSMPDGTHGQLLHGAEQHMRNLCTKISDLHSKYDLETNKSKCADGWDPARLRRRTLRGRLHRARARLRNWMRNMHYESIKHTLELADLIILPVFGTQRMVRRAERVFGNSTTRDLYTWSHYSFSQRLYHKAEITANKTVIYTDEPGTSITCDACGHVQAVGKQRLFVCQACHHSAGRDIGHASRGNLLAAVGIAMNIDWDGVER
jgi:transposase